MNIFKYLILLTTFVTLVSCSTRLNKHKELGWTCKDIVRHTGCVKSSNRYDNIDLHAHDPREIRDLEVPD